jgi:hypothetical protein
VTEAFFFRAEPDGIENDEEEKDHQRVEGGYDHSKEYDPFQVYLGYDHSKEYDPFQVCLWV